MEEKLELILFEKLHLQALKNFLHSVKPKPLEKLYFYLRVSGSYTQNQWL